MNLSSVQFGTGQCNSVQFGAIRYAAPDLICTQHHKARQVCTSPMAAHGIIITLSCTATPNDFLEVKDACALRDGVQDSRYWCPKQYAAVGLNDSYRSVICEVQNV